MAGQFAVCVRMLSCSQAHNATLCWTYIEPHPWEELLVCRQGLSVCMCLGLQVQLGARVCVGSLVVHFVQLLGVNKS